VKYAFIDQHRHEHRIQAMCRILGVARSGFYAWCRNKAARAAREERQQAFDQQVQGAFNGAKQRCGSPRLTRALCEQGVSVRIPAKLNSDSGRT